MAVKAVVAVAVAVVAGGLEGGCDLIVSVGVEFHWEGKTVSMCVGRGIYI